MYKAAGIDLRDEPLVGLGSVCRRQSTDEIAVLVQRLHGLGLRLHGFGVKTEGLRRYGKQLASADSMAWSLRGRYVRGCAHRKTRQRPVASETNCVQFAREWRGHVLVRLRHETVGGGRRA